MSTSLRMFSDLNDRDIFRFPGTSRLYVRYSRWAYSEPGEPFMTIPEQWDSFEKEYMTVNFMVERVYDSGSKEEFSCETE